MFYGCWTSRQYPKWFCKRHFSRIATMQRGGALPHKVTFYHWRRNPLTQEMFYVDKDHQDLVLMYVHPEKYEEKHDDENIRFNETDIPFFKRWIGSCCFCDEISVEDWRKLDKFCFETENPMSEY